MTESYCVYMLLCKNGAIYTGITNDLIKRMEAHIKYRSAAKFTKSFKPEKILACWNVVGDRGPALRVEYYIKKLNSAQKKSYVEDFNLLCLDCERDLVIGVSCFLESEIEELNKNLF